MLLFSNFPPTSNSSVRRQRPNVCFPLTSPATGSCPAAASQWLTVLSALGSGQHMIITLVPGCLGRPTSPIALAASPFLALTLGMLFPVLRLTALRGGDQGFESSLLEGPRTQPLLPRLSSCPSLPGCRSGSGAPGAHCGGHGRFPLSPFRPGLLSPAWGPCFRGPCHARAGGPVKASPG